MTIDNEKSTKAARVGLLALPGAKKLVIGPYLETDRVLLKSRNKEFLSNS